jgi:glycosyltransferase involved in cell wall biosynthesis
MRVGIDATPLLGARTGIGRYVAGLIAELARQARGEQFTATAFSRAPASELRRVAPDSFATRGLRVPASLLHRLWATADVPPVSFWCGRQDVFHATNFVLPPTGRAAGVLSVHDLSYLRHPDYVSPASLRFAELVPRGLRRAEVVCALSITAAAEISAEYGVEPARIVIAAPGVDLEWFTAEAPPEGERQRLGLPKDYLLAVGSLEPRKNLPLLLEAHRRACAQDSSIPPLVLAGPTGWGPRLGLADLPPGQVRLLGYLPDAVLRSVVAGARALVYPSRYEGFGLPPLEALAAGVPAIVSDLTVCREVLGSHARYFPPTDADALADQLSLLSFEPAARQAGRDHARAWTWAGCAQAVLGAYRTAASSR